MDVIESVSHESEGVGDLSCLLDEVDTGDDDRRLDEVDMGDVEVMRRLLLC